MITPNPLPRRHSPAALRAVIVALAACAVLTIASPLRAQPAGPKSAPTTQPTTPSTTPAPAAAPAPTPRSPGADRQLKDFEPAPGVTMRYTLILPEAFDAARAYPVLIMFPPAAQNFQMMSASVGMFTDEVLKKHPWVIVIPAALDNSTFFTGSEKHIKALFADVQSRVLVEGSRFHLAGMSNGGVACFRIATTHPDRVASLTTLPGYPLPEDTKRLNTLKSIPVRMYVGSDDRLPWIDAAKNTEAELKRLNADVLLKIFPTEGHIIRSMNAEALLNQLEPLRKRDGTQTPDHGAVLSVLDALHQHASKGDGEKYFELFTPNAVFIGTDATERWSLDQFKAYALPLFARGRSWTYKPRAAARNVELSDDRSIAWFDELLDNDKYGLCRGTGVLRKIDGKWRITQYHLTVPIPNELLERVSAMVKAKTPKEPPPSKEKPR